jgi:SAM-dependent methyltransferase
VDRAVYDRMATLEDSHWWFVGRRGIVATMIDRFVTLPTNGRVLEAGCGTGGNLGMLSRYGMLQAFEHDKIARDIAQEKSGMAIESGSLPGMVPYESETFGIILLLDVLEHIEDDVGALAALRERLAADGRVLVTVPAFPALWSSHDETHHHYRRYTRRSLAEVAEAAGFEVERLMYFNFLLLPVAVAVRWLKVITGSHTPDDSMPAPWLNALLRRVFGAERYIVGRVPIPAGLSCGAILKRSPKW